MKDIYYIDLGKYTLDKFEHRLLSSKLLPGRRILLENIEANFSILRELKIRDVKQLLDLLKNKDKIERVSNDTGIPSDYLTILRREAGSFLPTLVTLEKIIEPENTHYISILGSVGIKNSKQLFECSFSKEKRFELSKNLAIPYPLITRWVELCDLLRINGVGPVFAFMLYEAGIRRVEQFLNEPISDLIEKAQKINSVKAYTKVKLSVKDIAYCIEYARELDLVLEIN
jgi:hypothetical protein